MSKEQYLEVAEKVIQWAHDRNLIKGSTPANQFLKLAEELKEVSTAENDEELLKEVGDFHVVSIIMLEQMGLNTLDTEGSREFVSHSFSILMGDIAESIAKNKNSRDCIVRAVNEINHFLPVEYSELCALTAAYDKIKDRKGEMRNGVFVKEADL